ncbi:DUF1134 domain-containing protein [Novosphingobium sp. G106]|uniref:DUF1134 domain-containing protein n=1 Tax=Novosphingobium sp. G106 TaxID=2849500 RepID=UPI001C2DC7C9|nr:DUF1134 domain-containing protein [Novosphingobium sp. G106]MBV1691491.1 DUF1134 domain-containing protein [Novosphingobium sp. G106]
MARNTSLGTAAFAVVSALAMIASPAAAQIRSVDPDKAIDADLSGARTDPVTVPAAPASSPTIDPVYPATPTAPAQQFSATSVAAAENAPQNGSTFHKDDLIGAAEGVFGKGSRGLAMMIEDILRKQGEPNGYIIGREGGGALVVGLRYGSGTLHHKVEGQRPVYWTGPSIGFDAGANAGNAFVLVYNLYDTQDLYHRFGAGEGQAYLVGGFNVSYLRRGNVVLVPVRMGAGLRFGINAGYMKFSDKQKWLPF